MTRADFIQQLKELGFVPEEKPSNFVVFPFTAPLGKFVGQKIMLGFQINGDVALNPPGGPHVSPPLHPIHTGNDVPHPLGGVHNSGLGAEWQYWSRPFKEWDKTDKSAKTYMAHIYKLFDTQ